MRQISTTISLITDGASRRWGW